MVHQQPSSSAKALEAEPPKRFSVNSVVPQTTFTTGHGGICEMNPRLGIRNELSRRDLQLSKKQIFDSLSASLES
jgi:hypothetical protein